MAKKRTTSKPKLAVVVRPLKAKPAAPPRQCGPTTTNALLETLAEDEEEEPAAYTWIKPKLSLLQAARKHVDEDDGWELDPLQGIWSGLPGERGPIAYGSGSGWGPIQGMLLASSGSWIGGSPGGLGTGRGVPGMSPVAVPEGGSTGIAPGTLSTTTYIPPPGSGPGDNTGGGGGGGGEGGEGGGSEKFFPTSSESSQPTQITSPFTAALVMLGIALTARALRRR